MSTKPSCIQVSVLLIEIFPYRTRIRITLTSSLSSSAARPVRIRLRTSHAEDEHNGLVSPENPPSLDLSLAEAYPYLFRFYLLQALNAYSLPYNRGRLDRPVAMGPIRTSGAHSSLISVRALDTGTTITHF